MEILAILMLMYVAYQVNNRKNRNIERREYFQEKQAELINSLKNKKSEIQN